MKTKTVSLLLVLLLIGVCTRTLPLFSLRSTPIPEHSSSEGSPAKYDFETQSTPPPVEWTQTYGGADDDFAHSVVHGSGGGYAIAGTFAYNGSSGDMWLVKTDWAGNVEWNQTYGGPDEDYGYSIARTSDGGYALAGYTGSFEGGWVDAWLVKTDADGNAQWNKTYGGEDIEVAHSVIQTSDGGYAIAGYLEPGPYFWLVKTDADGVQEWNETYGLGFDIAYSMVQTSDGGYALAGMTNSFGAEDMNLGLVKTDANGVLQWGRAYGGPFVAEGRDLVQTSDGGYALAGSIESYGAADHDLWLVKTDADGNMEWNQTYGGVDSEYAYSVVRTSDGGYALAGTTNSSGADGYDFWLVKTDANGVQEWAGTYGGAGEEVAYSVVQTSDRGYALAGTTNSSGADGYDFWLVKTLTHILDINTWGGGTTSPATGGHSYSAGTVVSVTALPNTGYYFDYWMLDGVINTTNPVSVTMDTDHMLMAYFAYNITIEAYCYTESADVSVDIRVNGIPTGYNTPHTFTGLNWTYTFTVPGVDVNGHSFSQWSTGETSTVITACSNGTYVALYGCKDVDIEPPFGVVDILDSSAVAVNYLRNVTRLTRSPTSWASVTSPGWYSPHFAVASDDVRAACADDGAAAVWKDFMFTTIGWTGVHKVEVGLETWTDEGGFSGDNVVIALSDDNGTTWSSTTYIHTVDTEHFDAFTWVDVTNAYGWTPDTIRSVAVKLTYQTTGGIIRVDYLVVAVTPLPLLGAPSVFDSDADVNNDRVVDINDLVSVAMDYGPYGPAVSSQFAPASHPYTSRPTNYSFSSGVHSHCPTLAYDGDNDTYADWSYGCGEDWGWLNGYFELLAYGPTADPPRGAIITQVDLHVVYEVFWEAYFDATLNITYVVDPSPTVTVLRGPVTEPYGWYNLTWTSQAEPNDGTWSWEDLSNLRFRFGRDSPDPYGDYGYMNIYEVWATVHYERAPQLSVNLPGQTQSKNFSVPINVTAVEELYGWEFRLYYNTTVLTATGITLGPFLNTTAGTANTFGRIVEINDAYNATHGLVWATQTIKGDIRGGRLENGNWGVLATLDFFIDASGNSPLIIETTLAGHNFVAKKVYPIQHNVTTGVVDAIKLDGDINGDGGVDNDDLILLERAYGSSPSRPNWNRNADTNRDNLVNVLDLFILSKNFGKTL